MILKKIKKILKWIDRVIFDPNAMGASGWAGPCSVEEARLLYGKPKKKKSKSRRKKK